MLPLRALTNCPIQVVVHDGISRSCSDVGVMHSAPPLVVRRKVIGADRPSQRIQHKSAGQSAYAVQRSSLGLRIYRSYFCIVISQPNQSYESFRLALVQTLHLPLMPQLHEVNQCIPQRKQQKRASWIASNSKALRVVRVRHLASGPRCTGGASGPA
jgi:hypothetical protein